MFIRAFTKPLLKNSNSSYCVLSDDVSIEKEHDSEGVNKVNSGKSDNNKDRVKENPGKDKLKTTCTKCGYNVHYRGKCPAKDQVCNFCDKRGHYESVCFNKRKKKQLCCVTIFGLSCRIVIVRYTVWHGMAF